MAPTCLPSAASQRYDRLMTEDDDRRELAESIGEALIEWSRVEHVWANIFRDLLFGGIGEQAIKDPHTGEIIPGGDAPQKNDRADALFFAQKSSHVQFGLIEAVGKVSLASRPELLLEFKAVLKRTRDLSGTRNSIAHAYYDSRVLFRDGQIEITPVHMLDFGRFKKAPEIVVADAANDFASLADDIYAFWEMLIAGPPIDARPTRT
jgi:hypothetical protein